MGRLCGGTKSTTSVYQIFSSLLLVIVLSGQSWGILNVEEFFPDLGGDLTRVQWAHAVNSQEELLRAVEGTAMMLEADILMGLTPGSTVPEPIMAHPPNVTSNLSFKGFLATLIRENKEMGRKKGMKLDFKDLGSVEPVLSMLEHELENNDLNFPVWLNADVLKGPINSTKEPINGTAFIRLAKRYLPTATLSLGWTTRFGSDDINTDPSNPNLSRINGRRSGYTDQNVKDMVDLISHNWDGPLTFAVRAGLITISKESGTQLTRLLAETLVMDVTFTIWSAPDDPVDTKKLKNWILMQQGNLYIDLPFDIDEGPLILPERPLGRIDQLQSSSSRSKPILTLLSVVTAVAVSVQN